MNTTKLDEAALWLATGGKDKGRAVVPQLVEKYGMTAAQACEAIRQANLIRARAM
jgi:hypothetical protein